MRIGSFVVAAVLAATGTARAWGPSARMDMTSAVLEAELTVVAERSGTIDVDGHTLSRYVVRESLAGSAAAGDELAVVDGDWDVDGTARAVLFLVRLPNHDKMWRPIGAATRAEKDGKALRFDAHDGRFEGPTQIRPNTPTIDHASHNWYVGEIQPGSFDDAIRDARAAIARAGEWKKARAATGDDRHQRTLAFVGADPSGGGFCPSEHDSLDVRALYALADDGDVDGVFAAHDKLDKALAECIAQPYDMKIYNLSMDKKLPGPARARAHAFHNYGSYPNLLAVDDPSVEVRRVAAGFVGEREKCLGAGEQDMLNAWLARETDAAVIYTLTTKKKLARCRR